MRRALFAIVLFSIPWLCLAQQADISGTVVDETGMPVPGVNIIEKNTSNGAQTDFDGNFQLTVASDQSIIVLSYIGYKTQELTVGSRRQFQIAMVEDLAQLDEVVVVGYGTQTKKEITGAVSVISAETIEDLKPVRIEQALQGQVAGVQITSGSGAPGSGLNIAIRGISTNGDNRPLILLDGNVIEDLSVVNPADIESINVLKDATAGIYGVRAANGVILITTKNGRLNSEVRFDVKSYYGIQETTRKIPVLNATEYALLVNEARTNGGQAPLFNDISSLGQGTDWQDEVFEAAPIYNVDLTVSGGGEKSRTSFGLSYLNQDGIVGGGDNSKFTRLTSRLSYDLDFLDNFKFTSSIIFSGTKNRNLLENTIGSVLYNAVNNAPTFDIRDENGEFTIAEGLGNEVINPLAQIENTFNTRRVRRLSGSFGLSYNFLEKFTIESRIQANYAEEFGKIFSPIAFYGSGKVFNIERNNITEFANIFRDYTFDNFITYKDNFGDHNLNVILGSSVFQTTGRFVSFTGFDLPQGSGINADLDLATEIVDNFQNGGNAFDARLLSYFARVQYDYLGKYLFSGVVRRDGSTKFGPQNKFGWFPSASVGWIASDESFLENSGILDFLKFRASYGIIGNDRIPDFRFESVLNGEGVYVIDNELVFGTAIGAISNPEIRWEEQKTFDVGLDAKFFNNALDLTFDYFQRRTEDLLVTAPVSGILGASAPGSAPPVVNAGTVENKGFELSLSYFQQISNDFDFRIGVNGTTLENEVLFVNSDNAFIPGGSFGVGQDFPSRMEAGFPIGYFYGLKTDGIFQTQEEIDNHAVQENATPGDIRFVDMNGDGIITSDDRTNIGDPIPDFTFGFNLSVNYKSFSLQAYAFGSVGNDIVRNYERFQPLTNRSTAFLNRWTGPGSTNEFPKVTTGATSNTQFSDYFVEDGSFLRMQNIQLGYDFQNILKSDGQVDGLTAYVAVQNAFTLTEYQGFDPTASSGAPIGGGIDFGFYPAPRTYLLGVNLNF